MAEDCDSLNLANALSGISAQPTCQISATKQHCDGRTVRHGEGDWQQEQDPTRHEGHRRHEDHGPLAADHVHDVAGDEDGGDATFHRRDFQPL